MGVAFVHKSLTALEPLNAYYCLTITAAHDCYTGGTIKIMMCKLSSGIGEIYIEVHQKLQLFEFYIPECIPKYLRDFQMMGDTYKNKNTQGCGSTISLRKR